MSSFTPGPWYARVWGNKEEPWPHRRVSIGPEYRGHSAVVLVSPRYANEAQAMRDATLAAAAPEMFRALQLCPDRVDYPNAEEHSTAVEQWLNDCADPAVMKATEADDAT